MPADTEEYIEKKATFLIMCPNCWKQFAGIYKNVFSEEDTEETCIQCPECDYAEWL